MAFPLHDFYRGVYHFAGIPTDVELGAYDVAEQADSLLSQLSGKVSAFVLWDHRKLRAPLELISKNCLGIKGRCIAALRECPDMSDADKVRMKWWIQRAQSIEKPFKLKTS